MSNPQRSQPLLSGANLALAAFVIGSCVLIAIGVAARMDYGYYIYVRIATSLTAIALAASVESRRWLFLRPPLIVVAVLYNFIIPVHLSRALWFPINILTILLFLGSYYPALLPKDKSDA